MDKTQELENILTHKELIEQELIYLTQCVKAGRYVKRGDIVNCTTCRYSIESEDDMKNTPCLTCNNFKAPFSNWKKQKPKQLTIQFTYVYTTN